MKHLNLLLGSVALAMAAPVLAQVPPAPTGMMTATDVGVSPLSGTSATDYVKMAANADMYEIASSKVALSKTKNPMIKSMAHELITDHTATSKALMGALVNKDRTITRPAMMMSADNDAKVTLLRKTPKKSFDDLYLRQQLQAHQTAWALHKGYATEGTDPSLQQVAASAVPIVEKHLAEIKPMVPAGM